MYCTIFVAVHYSRLSFVWEQTHLLWGEGEVNVFEGFSPCNIICYKVKNSLIPLLYFFSNVIL